MEGSSKRRLLLLPSPVMPSSLAEAWGELGRQAELYGERLRQLSKRRDEMSAAERRLLERATQLHSGVKWDLWHAGDADNLLRRETATELD